MVLGLAGLLVIGGFLLFNQESPDSAGAKFMFALAKGDSAKLTDLSYISGASKEDIKKQWDYATKVAAPHYLFAFRLNGSSQSSPDEASVKVMMFRNVGDPGSYEEKFELPMVRKEGRWLVDVAGINRGLYPALPR